MLLEEHVHFLFFDILLSSYKQGWERKKIDFHQWTSELPANQGSRFGTPVGCVDWLVTQKSTCGSRLFFLFPLLLKGLEQNIKK